MCNFATKVNSLKIRFFLFSIKPYFFSSNLSKNDKKEKDNLITLLIINSN
jgi:hypothetical protein